MNEITWNTKNPEHSEFYLVTVEMNHFGRVHRELDVCFYNSTFEKWYSDYPVIAWTFVIPYGEEKNERYRNLSPLG